MPSLLPLNRRFGMLVLAALSPCVVHAQLVNGAFDSGLSGWSTLGDASIQAGAPQGANQLWLTTASALFQDDFPAAAGARNRSGTTTAAAGGAGGVEDFTGVPLGGLDPNPASGVYAYEGSAARQVFTAASGSTLSFAWDMGTSDHVYDDLAFVVVDGVVTRLATSTQAVALGTLDNTWRTGFSTASFTLSGSGAHSLSFGVVDIGDFSATSTLAIAGVQLGGVSAVPESPGALLGLASLAMLGVRFGRRR